MRITFGLRAPLLTLFLLAAGCGPNGKLSSTKQHPSGWNPNGHITALAGQIDARGRLDLSSCAQCHTKSNQWDCWDCHDDFPKKTATGPVAQPAHDQPANQPFPFGRCVQCHTDDTQSPHLAKKGCADCHDQQPHEEDFEAAHHSLIASRVTNEAALVPGTEEQFPGPNNCLPCHPDNADTRETGRFQKPGCQSCHAGGTRGFADHSDLALLRTAHKDVVKPGGVIDDRRIAGCATCHSQAAEDLPANHNLFFDRDSNPQRPPMCIKCHTDGSGQKHWSIENWSLADIGLSGAHPNYLFDRSCAPCHGLDENLAGGIARACTSCHAGGFFGLFVGHNSDPKSTHKAHLRAEAERLGLAPLAVAERQCQACHSQTESRSVVDQYSGATKVIPACLSCHPADHFEPGFVAELLGGNHAARVGSEGTSNCQECHAPDLTGSVDGLTPGCQTCHSEGKEYGRVPHLAADWGTLRQHGAHVFENTTDRCYVCHPGGAEIKTWLDGRTVPTCFTCHLGPTGNPHPDGWFVPVVGGEHRAEVGRNGFGQCQECHGATFDGDLFAPACAGCHAAGNEYGVVPHKSSGWRLDEHGLYVFAATDNRAKCLPCHDSEKTWTDGTTVKSCVTCHPQSHLDRIFPTYSATDSRTHNNSYDSSCQACHYDGGKLWTTCASCHTKFPLQHSPYNPEFFTKGSPNSHSRLFQADKASCQRCHGEDNLGGITGVSCSSSGCHPNPAEHFSDAWRGSGHAILLISTYYELTPDGPVMRLGPDGANCKSCHYDGGKLWTTCETCHPGYPKLHSGYVRDPESGLLVPANNPFWGSYLCPDETEPDAVYRSEQSHCGIIRETVTGCAVCHGQANEEGVIELIGGREGFSCYTCHSPDSIPVR